MYTKGEWRVEEDLTYGYFVGNGEVPIANIARLPEEEANAHLIVQAPGMADWLKRMIKQGGWVYQSDLNEAKELIAKAEGK